MTKTSYIPRLYGRRQDKALKPRQAKLMLALLPVVSVARLDDEKPDPMPLLSTSKEAWLEIGFGGGEHLAWHAEQHKNITMIGAEPFINGVSKLLVQIEERSIENVRIHHGDARPLIEALPDASLSRMFILHPDPWPKKRHHKRRIVSPWMFREAARLLKKGSQLRIASDIPDYIRWTLMHAQSAPEFRWTAEKAEDWQIRPSDWPQTRYEAKAIREGRVPTYLIFERL